MKRAIMTSVLTLGVVGAMLGAISRAAASPSFNALGVLPGGQLYSRAHGISGDGTTVVGESGTPNNGYGSFTWRMAFRWTESTGMELVGPAGGSSRAFGVSRDGAVVVGAQGAWLWRGGTTTYLTQPGSNWRFVGASDVSDDGSVVVGTVEKVDGWSGLNGGKWEAGGITVYSGTDSGFSAITRVGGEEIIAGEYPVVGGYEPAIFRNASVVQTLGSLGPSAVNRFVFGQAVDVSANGRAVVGYSSSPRAGVDWYEAFRWTQSQGIVGLGDLPGGDYGSWAWATSANGGVVVGKSNTRYTPNYRGTNDAFYWTPTAGMQKLSTLLTDGFGLNLSGWSLLDDATGVDDSGLRIVGWGTRTNGSEEAFRVKLQQQIYINWDDPIGTGFKVMKRPRSLKEDVITVPGSWSGLVLPPTLANGMTPKEYKDHVMSELNAIFAASGVDLDILDSRYDSKRSAALEVRFGPPVTGATGKSLLDGKAWDVAPAGLPGVDRFNSRWDGQVAVFISPGAGLETPGYTADNIAHEVGHGLGLRHILPGARAPNEVMDYAFAEGTVEEFNDLVSQIIEPPTADGTPEADTHNPYYHLKRYVLGEDPGTSQPGTWDVGSITIQKFEITSINHASKLYNVTPGAAMGAGAEGLECETWSNLAYFAELDPGQDKLDFFALDGFPLSILASSEPGALWDIVFGTGDADNPVLTFENLANGLFDGLLFQYDSQVDAYHVVGSFSGLVAEEMTLSGLEPIPEPATMALLAVGVLAILRRRTR